MFRLFLFFPLLLLCAPSCFAADAPAAPTPDLDFERAIAPIFAASCLQCHGPEKSKGKLRLHLRSEAFKKDYNIIPGDPDESEIIYRLTLPPSDEERMPPAEDGFDPLPKEQIDLLRRWIQAGAPWPDDFEIKPE